MTECQGRDTPCRAVPAVRENAGTAFFQGLCQSAARLRAVVRRRVIATQPVGNTSGLKPSQLKALNRLGQRRYPAQGGYSIEQARELCALSRVLGRQIGLLIDRQGKVETVILGEPGSILIPALARGRSGAGRLRGVRLLHTHLTQDPLTQEDLMDLLFLRLDSVGVLTVHEWGDPVSFQSAHLLPGEGAQPYRVHEMLPWDRVERDFTAEAEALEEELGRVASEAEAVGEVSGGSAPRAVLVSVAPLPRAVQERHLAELAELARTAGVVVTGTLIQRVAEVHSRHILGRGKLAELEVLALQGQAGMIIFDGELTPAQLTSLTSLTERKVLDRTQLILDIFATRASTRAGRLQVEMAQLKYTLPRLVGRNRAMDRLMGGIGGRGPGETKLETDRRRIRERMGRIRRELEALRRQRSFVRARRARQGLPVVALVGYTNTGKSTLLNALTQSDVLAENKLFATLDPTTRRLRFPREHELVLTDTVGFIRNLPKELTEAFQATLEELEGADLFLHVVDASHPEIDQQIEAVETVLADMGLQGVPRVVVLNKWDAVPENAIPALPDAGDAGTPDFSPLTRDVLRARWPEALCLSARTGEGLAGLSQWLLRWLERRAASWSGTPEANGDA